MEKDGMKEIFDIVEEKLSGLDSITRREVLKKLLKSSAFLAILTGGGLGMLTSSLSSAAERKYISVTALTSPVPDRNFKLTRTHLSDGFNAAFKEAMEEIIRDVSRQVEEFKDMEILIPSVSAASDNQQCPSHCTWQGCTDNMCTEQRCPRNTCAPSNNCDGQDCHWNVCRPVNTCGSQGCPTHGGCEGRNVCDGQGCGSERYGQCSEEAGCQTDECVPRQSQDPCGRHSQTWVDPKDFLDRYSDQPFVRELKELFGNNVLLEIEGMIRNKTTLRGRGLIDPGAPTPPPTKSLDEMLRDLPGARMPQPPAPPPAATVPTAPGAPPTAPAAPPTVTPTAPPPAAPPTGPAPGAPPVHKPPVVAPTPVAPTPVAPPPAVPTPVVPAPVTPIAPTPITPPKPVIK